MIVASRRFMGLQPPALDITLASGLTVVNVVSLLAYRSHVHPLAIAVGLVAAQSIALAGRTSRPVSTLLITGIARVAYDMARFGHAPFPLATAVALYTVADRCPAHVRRWVACVSVVAIAASQFGSPHDQPYDVTVAVLIFATAWLAGIASRTRRAYLGEVEQRARSAEADLDRRTAAAAAAERARIARELHDIVAHHVSLIAVQAEAVASLLPDRPVPASAAVEVIGTTAREALTELRRLLGVLRSSDEPLDTAPAASLAELDGLLHRISDTGLSAELTVNGTPRRLPATVDFTAYRIIQEALTNTVRHASAHRALVTVTYDTCHLGVTVTDEGKAHAEPLHPVGDVANHRSSGFGLAGIAERVASCGGSLTLGPTASGRFSVSARLPT